MTRKERELKEKRELYEKFLASTKLPKLNYTQKTILEILFDIGDDLGRTYIAGFGRVYDPVIMQFTGLQDKNGVDIYEDDIFLVKNRYCRVVWHSYLAQWDTEFIRFHESVVDKFRVEWIPGGLKNCDWDYYAEVVGNIFDNPELVKP